MADNQTDTTALERFAKSIGGTFRGFGEEGIPIIDIGAPDATGQKPTLDSLYLQDSENMQVLSHPDPDLPPVPTAANFNTRTEPGGRTFGQRLQEMAQASNENLGQLIKWDVDIAKSVPWALFDSVANFARNQEMAGKQTQAGMDGKAAGPSKGAPGVSGAEIDASAERIRGAIDKSVEASAKMTAYFEELAKPYTPQTMPGRFTGEMVRYGVPAIGGAMLAPEVAGPVWGARVITWGSRFLAGLTTDAGVGYYADDPRRSIQTSTRGVTDDQLAEAGILGSAVALMRKMTSFLALPDEAFDESGELKDESWEEARRRMAGEQMMLNPFGEALMLAAKGFAKGIRAIRSAGLEDQVIDAGEKAGKQAADREAMDPSLITNPDALQQALRDGEALGYVTSIMRDIRPANTAEVIQRYDQAFAGVEQTLDLVAPLSDAQRATMAANRMQRAAETQPRVTDDSHADLILLFNRELGIENGAKALMAWMLSGGGKATYLDLATQARRGLPFERMTVGGKPLPAVLIESKASDPVAMREFIDIATGRIAAPADLTRQAARALGLGDDPAALTAAAEEAANAETKVRKAMVAGDRSRPEDETILTAGHFDDESKAQMKAAEQSRATGRPYIAVPSTPTGFDVVPYTPAEVKIDPEGRELRALMIFGDEPAKTAAILQLARILARDVDIAASTAKMGGGFKGYADLIENHGQRSVQEIAIHYLADDRATTLSHETGHALSWLTYLEDKFDRTAEDAVIAEARAVSKEIRPAIWDDTVWPADRLPALQEYRMDPAELMADFLGLYMRDPEKAKSMAPNLAKLTRSMVNVNPKLRDIVQFLGIGALLLPMAKGGDDGEG